MLTWMEEPTDSAGACSVSYLEGQSVWSYEMVMTSYNALVWYRMINVPLTHVSLIWE